MLFFNEISIEVSIITNNIYSNIIKKKKKKKKKKTIEMNISVQTDFLRVCVYQPLINFFQNWRRRHVRRRKK